jgi:hypothetical protein
VSSLPSFLGTPNPRNVGFYERHGLGAVRYLFFFFSETLNFWVFAGISILVSEATSRV